MPKDTAYLLVLTTCQEHSTAEKIARDLVENKAAACVNIIPNVASYFKWKDNLVSENELLLLIKTSSECFTTVKNRILSLHPYELPEIIAVPIKHGLKDYLSWIGDNTE